MVSTKRTPRFLKRSTTWRLWTISWYVEWGAEEVEGAFEAVDGHIDAGTEAARIGENDFHANPPWMEFMLPKEDAKAKFD